MAPLSFAITRHIDSFAQTALSECLRTSVPGSMRLRLRMIGRKTRRHMRAGDWIEEDESGSAIGKLVLTL